MPHEPTTTLRDRDDPPLRVVVIGSTGSIGTQTLDVIERLAARAPGASGEAPARFEIVGLAASSNGRGVLRQAASLGVGLVCIADAGARAAANAPAGVRVVARCEELIDAADAGPGADVLVAAAPGVTTLGAVEAWARSGRPIALANKEALVAAGPLLCAAGPGGEPRYPSRIHQIDSEHTAASQLLLDRDRPEPLPIRAAGVSRPFPSVERLVLTASGGPFRTWPAERIARAEASAALDHPTWDMGAKVTTDSASLTNKAFELIEAYWLFGLGPDRLAAVVHPESIVHALAEHRDGSVVAQLGERDMRLSIQRALLDAARGLRGGAPDPSAVESPGPRLDLAAIGRLTFEEPDLARFPSLGLAFEAMRLGGGAGAALNAANDVAVGAFLGGAIPFGRIAAVQRAAMDDASGSSGASPAAIGSLDHVLAIDREARARAAERCGVRLEGVGGEAPTRVV